MPTAVEAVTDATAVVSSAVVPAIVVPRASVALALPVRAEGIDEDNESW